MNASPHRFLCAEAAAPPCGIVVFGGSGDLTKRKILPAIFRLFQRDLLPDEFFVLGFARSRFSESAYRDLAVEALGKAAPDASGDEILAFAQHCHYYAGSYTELKTFHRLAEELRTLAARWETGGNLLFYAATPPTMYLPIATNLGMSGLAAEAPANRVWRRLVLEKPFGHDLDSATELDRHLHAILPEGQLYRIDHYLGKETVQNIMILRFANAIFEPLWNRHYVDHVQITAAESIGIEGRAGYYDKSGLLRDMFQNHMMQLLALIAMDPPNSFDADRVRDEKIKALRSLTPHPAGAPPEQWVVRGQYAARGDLPGYREEDDVPPDSRTETFAAARLYLDNWRWHDVPFYLRSGKRLERRLTQIAIVFKQIPYSMFHPLMVEDFAPNALVLKVQPDEGGVLCMQAKHPGAKLCIGPMRMDFRFESAFGDRGMPDAYERLLLDAALGDQTLFIRSDTIQRAWEFLQPLLDAAADPAVDQTWPIHPYPCGTWGPAAANDLIRNDGRSWMTV